MCISHAVVTLGRMFRDSPVGNLNLEVLMAIKRSETGTVFSGNTMTEQHREGHFAQCEPRTELTRLETGCLYWSTFNF